MTFLLNQIHGKAVYGRRIETLARHLGDALPQDSTVLDIGCGDGLLAHHLLAKRPDLAIEGIDIIARPKTYITVRLFDGLHVPYPDKSVDVVQFVDVLHHADDPIALLREARRIARKEVVIKDHTQDGLLARETLQFMDYVGNARHGIPLPYTYWSRKKWEEVFTEVGLRPVEWRTALDLYPFPFTHLFDRALHIIVRLEPV